MKISNAKYFLAANSAEGFFSEFNSCYNPFDDWYAYIIKGGPGTGKSSFMKKVLKTAEGKGIAADEVYCTGDPDSLDAVILPALKIIIMDGTSPHVVDPALPGISDEIINFGQFWDKKKLEDRKNEVISATKRNKALHRSAAKYISAAGKIAEANLDITDRYTDYKKAVSFSLAIAEEFVISTKEKVNEAVRYLGGVTPKGLMYFTESAAARSKNVVAINDIQKSASNIVLTTLKNEALKRGCECIVYKNPLLPSKLIDAVLIPSASLLVLREDDDIKCEKATRIIEPKDLYKKAFDIDEQVTFLQHRKIVDELLGVAYKNLEQAKVVHDELESYYIAAMDFDTLREYTENICNRIFDI